MPVIPFDAIQNMTQRQVAARYSAEDIEDTLRALRGDKRPLSEGGTLMGTLSRAGSNLLPNAKDIGRGFVDAVSNPGQTLNAIGQLGRGGVDLMQGRDTPQADALREIGRTQNPFDVKNFEERPLDVLSTVGLGAGGLGAVTKAPLVSRLASSSGKLGAAVRKTQKGLGAIEKVADPIGTTIGAAAKGLKAGAIVGTDLLGISTGKGGGPIREGFLSGARGRGSKENKVFNRMLREEPNAKGERGSVRVVQEAKDAVNSIRPSDDFGALYKAPVDDEIRMAPGVRINKARTYGDVLVDTKQLKADIEKMLREDFNVLTENGLVDPTRSFQPFDEGEIQSVTTNFNKVLGMDDWVSFRNLDSLKTSVRKAGERSFVAARNEVANLINERLAKSIPGLEARNATYQKAIREVEKVEDAFGLKAHDESAQKAGASALEVSLTDNDDVALQALNIIEEETRKLAQAHKKPDLFVPARSLVSGQRLSTWIPGGLIGHGAGVGAVVSGQFWSLPIFSPRLVGMTVNRIGQALGGPLRLMEKIKKVQDRIRSMGLPEPIMASMTMSQALARILATEQTEDSGTLLQRLGGIQ